MEGEYLFIRKMIETIGCNGYSHIKSVIKKGTK